MSSEFSITRLDIPERRISILNCEGFVDAHTFPEMQTVVLQVLQQKYYKIIVDLTNVNYMSSAGVSVLLHAQSVADENHGKIVLLNLTPKVRQVFELMNLFPLFVLADDQAAALASL